MADQNRPPTELRPMILEQVRKAVYDYVKARLEKTDTHVTFSLDEVYIVWFSKTLQNWKAMVSTTLPDGMYYEVTYDGDKGKIYLDAYKKFDNVSIPMGQDTPLNPMDNADYRKAYDGSLEIDWEARARFLDAANRSA